jgi:hypothetical protein
MVKPKRKPVARRNPGLERRPEPPASRLNLLNRRMRTRLYGGVAGCVKKDVKASCCTKDEGGPFGCAKKKCKLHAVREMREGPSKPLCRERLQTATSCCGTMATVVNVVVKSVDRPRQVWMRETNASEPPIKHRNLLRRRQNRGLRGAPGSVWWKPVYWPDGVRCIGGVTLI